MIELKDITFTYKGAEEAALQELDLEIPEGEVVVLCGESGCGKTSVTRLINGLIPHYYEGELTGEIRLLGEGITQQLVYETAHAVGSVFQNPRSQFFNVDTTSEIAFGCENFGMDPAEIRRRIGDAEEAFDLEQLLDRNIFQLSGGEKQKIACAGASVMGTKILVLDEPSSNLDAASIGRLREILKYWKSQGRTVVLSEHRLSWLNGVADRFVYLQRGRVAADYTSDEFAALSAKEREHLGLRAYVPEDLKLYEDVRKASGEAFAAGGNFAEYAKDVPEAFFEMRNLRFSYKRGPAVLDIDGQRIPAGKIAAVIGHNGAGKSTFARCFCGLEKKCGTVAYRGQAWKSKDRLKNCYMVMQDVNHQLFTESVAEEVELSLEETGTAGAAGEMSPAGAAESSVNPVEKILGSLGLSEQAERHPMSLSGGQKQRTAIASAAASARPVIFFDEPTSGQDLRNMQKTAEVMGQLNRDGKSLFIITHDLEFILACCSHIIHLEDGQIREVYPLDEAGVSKVIEWFSSEGEGCFETDLSV